jgi:subtilisin
MATSGETPHPRRRRRRVTFLTLLLLVFAAPAGYVAAVQPVSPYVVIFRDDAVTVPDASAVAHGGATISFIDAALLANQPVPETQAVAGETAGAARTVDGGRVAAHVRDIETRTGVSVDDVYSSALGGFSAQLTPSQSAAIAADPSVAAVMPDVAVSLEDVDDAGLGGTIRTTSNPSQRVQPGVRRIGARSPQLNALTANGFRIDADVAIIDTGIQPDHPDLNVVGGYNCTSRDHTKWADNDGHGTHVAGIVGALDNRIGVTGVAPGVRLWSVKVLDGTGHGFLSWVVCGVDWVTAQRDKSNPSRPLIEVANMSLAFSGGDDGNCGKDNNDTLHMAICRSVDRGTVYVAAAGNDSQNARHTRPASYDEVITVSAMADYDGRGGGRGYPAESCPYWSGEADDAFTSFSNYGPDIDLIAPGKCVLSTYIGSRYAWMSGTSMATPHVTGAVAVYRMLYPRATPAQVQMALEAVGTHDWRTNTDPDSTHEPAVWIGQFREVPDFSMSTSLPSSTVAPGSTLGVNVSLARVGGFTDAIKVALGGTTPNAISATPVVTRGSNVQLTLRIGNGLAPGRYTVSVSATSGTVVHSSTVTFVVHGSPPVATFASPRSALTLTSDSAVTVSWNERAGGAQITGRRLDRQIASIRTAGSCDNVSWSSDAVRNNATDTTDHVRSGYCYRWALTLTDSAGNSSTAYSGAVLVDTSAPRAPNVDLAASAEYSPDLAKLGVDQAYVGSAGTLWVRAGVSGSVLVQVSGSDPESGIARNVASVTGGSGWRVAWVGSSVDGSLRLYYTANTDTAKLDVSSINNTGLEGPSTVGTLLSDASAPSVATWTSAPSDTTRSIRGAYFKLVWSGGADTGSGLAGQQIIGRYRAGLNSNGTCKTNGFSPDGGFRLASDASWDSGLQPSSCYVWSLRTMDNVGNTSAPVISGYIITLPDKKS